jgi:hypothetical protein
MRPVGKTARQFFARASLGSTMIVLWLIIFLAAFVFSSSVRAWLGHVTWPEGPVNVALYFVSILILALWPALLALIIAGGAIIGLIPRTTWRPLLLSGLFIAVIVGAALGAVGNPAKPPEL